MCCAQVITLLRVADISGLCIEGPVFLDTRSEFMQNELTAMRNRTTLLRAEANCALFAPCKTHGTEYRIRDG